MKADCPHCGKDHVTIPEKPGVYEGTCQTVPGHFTVVVEPDGHSRVVRGITKAESDARSEFFVAAVFLAVIVLGFGTWILVYLYGSNAAWIVFASVLSAALLAVCAIAHNRLSRALNNVRRSKAHLASILARRGVALEGVISCAQNAADHEQLTQIGVAAARSASPFSLGSITVEAPPNLEALGLFSTAQRAALEFEPEILTAWQAWADAAMNYENTRCTFPIIMYASLMNAAVPDRYPSLLGSVDLSE